MASAEYLWGTHAPAIHNAEALKTHVFPSTRAAIVVTGILGCFVSIPPQAPPQSLCQLFRSAGPVQGRLPSAVSARSQSDPTQSSALIFKSARTPPVVSSSVPAMVSGQAQYDLTPRGFVESPQISAQGPVPPFTKASQDDPSQRAALVWSPVTPTAVTPNPIASFFTTVSQFEERPSRQAFPNQVAGQTPPVIPLVTGGPQRVDLTQQAWLTTPSRTPAYALRSIYAAPQVVDLTQQGSIWSAQPAAPVVVGATLYKTWFSGPQVVDLTQQAYFQQAIQNGIVVPVVVPDQSTPGRTTGDGHSGRIIRKDWHLPKEDKKPEPPKQDKRVETAQLLDQGENVSRRIEKVRAQTAELQSRATKLESQLAEEGIIRTLAQQAALEVLNRDVQQHLLMLQVQEAVLREEQEIIDIAYVALMVAQQ